MNFLDMLMTAFRMGMAGFKLEDVLTFLKGTNAFGAIAGAGIALIMIVIFYALGALLLTIMGGIFTNATIGKQFNVAAYNMGQVAPVVGILGGVGVVLVLVNSFLSHD